MYKRWGGDGIMGMGCFGWGGGEVMHHVYVKYKAIIC